MYSLLVLELVILVLEANHQYSYSKILKASTRYSYSYLKVEYLTPSLPIFMFKMFTTFRDPLILKVSRLVSVSARSCLGLVSNFCSKSRSRGAKVSSRSRKFWPRLQLWKVHIANLMILVLSTLRRSAFSKEAPNFLKLLRAYHVTSETDDRVNFNFSEI